MRWEKDAQGRKLVAVCSWLWASWRSKSFKSWRMRTRLSAADPRQKCLENQRFKVMPLRKSWTWRTRSQIFHNSQRSRSHESKTVQKVSQDNAHISNAICFSRAIPSARQFGLFEGHYSFCYANTAISWEYSGWKSDTIYHAVYIG